MKTALIIGAGPAGLTCAYQLLRETDIHPIVVEESAFIGGISRTAEYKGNRMDLGGHRFFSKSGQVNAIWQEIMPMQGSPAKDDILLAREKTLAADGPDPEREERVMLLRERVSRIFYLRKFFDYPISMSAGTFINMGFSRTVKAGFGYLSACINKREESSLEDFYINRFGRPLYEMFFEDYTEKLWGVHPSKIAPDWGAQRVKELSLMKAVLTTLLKPFRGKDAEVTTSLIEQFAYPKRGPGQLWEVMADKIREMGGEIHMNTKVTHLARTESGAIGAVTLTDTSTDLTREINCDNVFSSMPIKDLFICMDGAPEDVSAVATTLPYRDFMTVGVLARKLKLHNTTKHRTVSNIIPDCWIYIQERDVRIGRLQVFNNWSPYMVEDLENTVWMGLEYFCDEGDPYWNMSDADFCAMATDELVKIGIVEREDVLDSVRLRVKKAYPAYFGSYKDMEQVRAYLSSIDNLYCIGRNGQHRYNNMDHSMLTAIEAIRLMRSGGDKSTLFHVNTEKAYHEEKSK